MKVQNLEIVQRAVAKAESSTSAEIVVTVVKQSGNYDHLRARLTYLLIIGWLLFNLDGALYHHYLPFAWNPITASVIFLALSIALGHYLAKCKRLIRWFSSPASIDRWVHLRAEVEFFENIHGKTRGATGVLIFVSLAEHRTVILADQPIFERVPKDHFDLAMTQLMTEIGRGQLAEGLVAAVTTIGEMLAREFSHAKDDVNELSDQVLLKDD